MKITDRINALIGGKPKESTTVAPPKPKSNYTGVTKQVSDAGKAMASATKNTKVYR